MAEKIFLQNKVMGNIIEVSAADWNNADKWGAEEREAWAQVESEEERNKAAWEQAVKDSKRHDAEVKKNDDLAEEGVATADAPPRSASGETTDTTTAAKRGKS